MRNRKRYILLGTVFIAGLFLFGWLNRSTVKNDGQQVYALAAPSLLEGGDAEAVNQALATVQGEIGMSAYFKSGTLINLDDVRSIYRTVEAQTVDYIIGSVPVDGYAEDQDVHLYVHKDGWFLVYYFGGDPVSKIIDWRDYTLTMIPTRFEKVLAVAAGAASIALPEISYYDFRHPDATELMFIAESVSGGSFFDIELPPTPNFTYYELSWSTYGGGMSLDGSGVGSGTYGTLTTTQLSPGTTHRISVASRGGLAILYGVQ